MIVWLAIGLVTFAGWTGAMNLLLSLCSSSVSMAKKGTSILPSKSGG